MRRRVLVWTLLAGSILTAACAPVRSEVWDAMRGAAIHADPPGATRLARTTNAPRQVPMPGMAGNEGWYDTLWASAWEPAQAFEWYAANYTDDYTMRDFARDDRFMLQGHLPGGEVVVTVEVATTPPQYGRITEHKAAPAGTRSYIHVWMSAQ